MIKKIIYNFNEISFQINSFKNNASRDQLNNFYCGQFDNSLMNVGFFFSHDKEKKYTGALQKILSYPFPV